MLIGPCEQGQLLIWKIEDRDLFQDGVDGGKGELSKNPVVKGIENCFGFLHPIELIEISSIFLLIEKIPGEFLASFLVNKIIFITNRILIRTFSK